MTVGVTVRCGGIKYKELKKEVIKELRKESAKELKKERIKDSKEFKERQKDFKELKEGQKDSKEFKEIKEIKEGIKEGFKDSKEFKEGFKEGAKDGKEFERPGGFGMARLRRCRRRRELERRSAHRCARRARSGGVDPPRGHRGRRGGSCRRGDALHRRLTATRSVRRALLRGALLDLEKRMAEGDPMAKREFDTPPKG